tara:strand:- start:10428 stop:11747 length:1320 start_codon:yes stop_codon:yes gene_type:complete
MNRDNSGLGVAETEDFAQSQVPEDHTYSGVHIALIIIGGTIGMAVFLMAAQVGSALGIHKAALAFVSGSLILGILGALTSYVGAKSRYSTYMLAEFAFGRKGALWVNALIALTLIGWYGVISNVFGQAASFVLADLYGIELPVWLFILLGSALMIGVTLSGFQGIDKLALYLVPFMVAFIGYAAWLSWGDVKSWTQPVANTPPISFSWAVSAVVGTYIVGVIIQPDYSRFARNVTHAVWAAFLALGLTFPLILFLTAVPSGATGESDLIGIMIAIGIGLPAFFLLLLGAWSSNVLCLYSSGLSLSTIIRRVHLWQIILVIGLVGTGLALMRAQEYFTDFLLFLGITIPPIGAIYVLDVLLLRRRGVDPQDLEREPSYDVAAFTAWGAATVMGYLAAHEVISLTYIASVDSILLAAVLYVLLKWRKKTTGAPETQGKIEG